MLKYDLYRWSVLQCYLPIHDLSIHYFADSRIHIHLNSSQFTEFLYYIHHNDTVNWKEIPNFFNSRFPIHGKFLVPKNVNQEVTLYILKRPSKAKRLLSIRATVVIDFLLFFPAIVRLFLPKHLHHQSGCGVEIITLISFQLFCLV